MVIHNTGKTITKKMMNLKHMIGILSISLINTFRLEDYESIQPFFKKCKITNKSKVWNIGCGNAEFSEKMYDDGYKDNINIDICENVITNMKKRNQQRNNLVFEVMDAMEMTYPNETFDLVIDKSTMDALLCGEHSFIDVAKMTREVSRVLKTGGYYFIISYGNPQDRWLHLQREHLDFQIEVITIEKQYEDIESDENVHYGYICKKWEKANDKLKNYDKVEKQWIDEENEEEEND